MTSRSEASYPFDQNQIGCGGGLPDLRQFDVLRVVFLGFRRRKVRKLHQYNPAVGPIAFDPFDRFG